MSVILEVSGLPVDMTLEKLRGYLAAFRQIPIAFDPRGIARITVADGQQAQQVRNTLSGQFNRLGRMEKERIKFLTLGGSPAPAPSRPGQDQGRAGPRPGHPPGPKGGGPANSAALAQGGPAAAALKTLPYAFVEIPSTDDEALTPATVLSAPVLHDRATGLSGELRCTLTALSPLLAGNDQYAAADVVQARRDPRWGEAKVIEPLYLRGTDESPVVIPGAALKGMVRGSVGALLAAPMERVAERKYLFRPNNARFSAANERRQLRRGVPAIVEGLMPSGTLRIRILPSADSAKLVPDNLWSGIPGRAAIRPGGDMPAYTLANVEAKFGSLKRGNGSYNVGNHTYHPTAGGLGGTNAMAQAFGAGGGFTYSHAVVPTGLKTITYDVPAEVLDAFVQTQQQLRAEDGLHFSNLHPLVNARNRGLIDATVQRIKAQDEMRAALTQPNQLIYVETENLPGGGVVVRSLGHHFRYVWRYVDSVRLRGMERRRAVLRAHPQELPLEKGKHQPPQMLTGARSFFGYVVDKKANEFGIDDLATGNFQRYAGRIAFNHAIEVDPRHPQRFQAHNGRIDLPLKILGSPRPSAVEFYLLPGEPRNDAATLHTYGDTGTNAGRGRLAGRKFYPHQPPTAWQTNLATQAPLNNQQVVLRGASAPGRTFRFKVRFTNLRPWELGVLIAALDPGRLAQALGIPGEYAVKLGHARPFGFGSARIAVDEIHTFDAQGQWQRSDGEGATGVAAFAQHLTGARRAVAEAWLKIHRWDDAIVRKYPEDGGKIYGWHTKLRLEHMTNRRLDP